MQWKHGCHCLRGADAMSHEIHLLQVTEQERQEGANCIASGCTVSLKAELTCPYPCDKHDQRLVVPPVHRGNHSQPYHLHSLHAASAASGWESYIYLINPDGNQPQLRCLHSSSCSADAAHAANLNLYLLTIRSGLIPTLLLSNSLYSTDRRSLIDFTFFRI